MILKFYYFVTHNYAKNRMFIPSKNTTKMV